MPYMQQAQAQKHVTHNEALELLDILVQLTVEAFDAVNPPAGPLEGQIWALGAEPAAAWTGQGGNLAAWSNGGWLFVSPKRGWRAALGAEFRIWTGDAWVAPGTTSLTELPGLGVNTGYDTENRLAVASPSVLLTHAGDDHRLKINKATPEDTASVLFQSDWSGRAEMGLAGEDDFSFKVSPDGSAWHTALTIAAADGIPDLRTGATIGGSLAYGQANVVGSVSQFGGVPTGAVIERGSNSNGSYVRFADGTQICWHRVNAGDATAFGSGTFNDPFRTSPLAWTYPAAFESKPEGFGRAWTESASANNRRMMFVSRLADETEMEQIQGVRWSDHTGEDATFIALMAIGRWF
jgi:hypothetical protein